MPLFRPAAVLLFASLPALSAAAAQTLASPAHFFAAMPQEAQTASTIAGFGPLDPAPPAGITPQEIIRSFGERETAFATARQNYTFRQTVRVDTISDDTGKPDGEYQQVTDITFNQAGKREEHVVFAPQNTLERVSMSPADFDDIEHRLPFVLTTADLPEYDVRYLGRQKVDDLETYVFSAAPKVIEKNRRYFQGKVWVDQQDLQIVLVDGKNVPDNKKKGQQDLSPPYTTYYEQVDGKYWFPTYTKAEGNLHFSAQDGALGQDVRLKTIVRYTDYKQFHATSRIIYNGEDITDKGDKTSPGGQPPAQSSPPK